MIVDRNDRLGIIILEVWVSSKECSSDNDTKHKKGTFGKE